MTSVFPQRFLILRFLYQWGFVTLLVIYGSFLRVLAFLLGSIKPFSFKQGRFAEGMLKLQGCLEYICLNLTPRQKWGKLNSDAIFEVYN